MPVQRILRRALFASAAVMAVAAFALPARAEIRFETSIQKAKARAAKEKKPILIDVYTDWCGWCKKLDADTYSKKDVSDYVNANFVSLKVNPEKDAATKKFVDQYKVEGYPTILFTDATGKEIHRQVGYQPGPQFLQTVKTARAKAKPAPKTAPRRGA
jgi:thiol:disulfide interchange protein